VTRWGGEGDAGLSQAQTSEPLGGAGHDGPAIVRERLEQSQHSGQNGEACTVGQFEVFNELKFGLAVKVRAQECCRLDGATAVGHFAGVFGIDAAHFRPPGPTAFNGADGGNQDAIHVEENAFATNLDRGRGLTRRHFSIVERAVMEVAAQDDTFVGAVSFAMPLA
jgi:hypothetical protein